MAMITDPEAYFTTGCGRCARHDTPDCSSLIWAEGQAALRALCLEAGLAETAKWGHPTYMHAGRNICLITALKGDYRINFMNAALMTDPDGIMTRQGDATAHPDTIKFTENTVPEAMRASIRTYLREAMGYAEAGVKAPKERHEAPMPDELTAALDGDPALAEAFAALTPGRRKSWAIEIGKARQAKTRAARTQKARDKIMAGKGALER